jgi:hypothetical protein
MCWVTVCGVTVCGVTVGRVTFFFNGAANHGPILGAPYEKQLNMVH